MGGVVTGTGRKGREAKYNLAEVHRTAAEITGTNKATGATEKVDTVEYTVSNISEALEVFGASEDALFAFISDALTDYAQRSARSALSVKIQGPAKAIIRGAKDFIKMFGSNPADAVEEIVSIGLRKGAFSQEFIDANKADLVNKLEKSLAGKDDEDAE